MMAAISLAPMRHWPLAGSRSLASSQRSWSASISAAVITSRGVVLLGQFIVAAGRVAGCVIGSSWLVVGLGHDHAGCADAVGLRGGVQVGIFGRGREPALAATALDPLADHLGVGPVAVLAL